MGLILSVPQKPKKKPRQRYIAPGTPKYLIIPFQHDGPKRKMRRATCEDLDAETCNGEIAVAQQDAARQYWWQGQSWWETTEELGYIYVYDESSDWMGEYPYEYVDKAKGHPGFRRRLKRTETGEEEETWTPPEPPSYWSKW